MYKARYNKNLHQEMLSKWAKTRDFKISFDLDIPKYGIVLFEKSEGICVGFLREIEDKAAFIDSMISNPEINGVLRNEALDILVDELIEEARRRKYYCLFAYTTEPKIVMRFELHHGFKILPHTLLGLSLERGD